VKRTRHITASELADCCVCEQRVVFDRLRGKRRTAQSREQMRAGVAAHTALHRQALQEHAGDARCFVATALWGRTDPRTQALRTWRDGWLLKRWWGSTAVRLYYAASPWLVGLLARAPGLQLVIDLVLSAVARRLNGRRQ
jgi:hypothetical protein